MSSTLDVRLGVLSPQVVLLPVDVRSSVAAEEAIELADAYGLCRGFPLDDSQRFTLRAALGTREDGSWAASTVCDFEGRQAGKNDSVAAREFAGLVLFGEGLLIHTAHEFPTANESFLRLVEVFEAWDDLRRKVARIRYANGEQGIELLTGQRLKYRARTGGSGRGFAEADLIVYDEAQHLQAEHVAASGPARLANPNSQAWYCGSGGLSSSRNAWRLRKRALRGDAGRFAYVEHTAEQVKMTDDGVVVSVRPDPSDRDVWVTHPAYGHRVSDENMQSLYDELGPDLFAREVLCVWDPDPEDALETVIPAGLWRECGDPKAQRGEQVAYALDVSPDLASAAIAVSDGRTVLVAEHGPGTSWVPQVLPGLLDGRPVWLDPRGPAGGILTSLTEAGVEWREIKAGDHAQACGSLLGAVLGGEMAHTDQPILNAAVAGATRRPYGDAWAWSRRASTVDISPLVAVTLARWAALQGSQPFFGAWR